MMGWCLSECVYFCFKVNGLIWYGWWLFEWIDLFWFASEWMIRWYLSECDFRFSSEWMNLIWLMIVWVNGSFCFQVNRRLWYVWWLGDNREWYVGCFLSDVMIDEWLLMWFVVWWMLIYWWVMNRCVSCVIVCVGFHVLSELMSGWVLLWLWRCECICDWWTA